MILTTQNISITSDSAVQNSFFRPLPDPMVTSRNVVGTSTPDQRSQDVIQNIVEGRKSWKTLRGHTEAVWPPPLEAALIQGLENYCPGDSRETRLLGRFPMRNKFISEHIFRVTGRRRTPKQVGSRLQQLRDTCGGDRLSELLLPARDRNRRRSPLSLHKSQYSEFQSGLDRQCARRYFRLSSGSNTSSNAALTCRDSASPTSGTSLSNRDPPSRLFPPSTAMVLIDILPRWYPAVYDSSIDSPPMPTSQILNAANASDDKTFRPSPYPRPLWAIDPTVTFISSDIISTHSSFTVFEDDRLVHTEVTQMSFVKSHVAGNDSLLYSTSMIPGFWPKICESPDPTRFTIFQQVFPNSDLENSRPSKATSRAESPVMFCATYKFNYPPGISLEPPSGSPPPASPGLTSNTENSHPHLLYHSSSPCYLPDDEFDLWSEMPSCAEYESYFDITDQTEVSCMRQSFHCLRNSPERDMPSAPPSPDQCQRHQIVPVSPSSTCFPTELSNYASRVHHLIHSNSTYRSCVQIM